MVGLLSGGEAKTEGITQHLHKERFLVGSFVPGPSISFSPSEHAGVPSDAEYVERI